MPIKPILIVLYTSGGPESESELLPKFGNASAYAEANASATATATASAIAVADAAAIANAVATAVWNTILEGTLTVIAGLRIMLGVLAGKSSGGGGTNLKFRNTLDTKNRVDEIVDSHGNRTTVTLNGDL